jgi:hypothetical protein
MFDSNWKSLDYVDFYHPVNMVVAGEVIYITDVSYLYLTDYNLNLISRIYVSNYRSISFDSFNSRLYTSSLDFNSIRIYGSSLNFIDSFSTLPYEPWALTYFNNKFYVGTQNGQILVYQNKTVIQQFQGCNNISTSVYSILFDNYGYMAISCFHGDFYLYFINGTYTNKKFSTPSAKTYIDFDASARLVLISTNHITFYG